MIQIACNEVKKYYGAQLVLSNITLEAQEQECYAIVGKNGCGKTTLLKLLKGVEKPDEGTIAVRKGATIGYLEQIPQYEDTTSVRDIIKQAFSEITKIKKQMEQAEQKMGECEGDELEKILKRYGSLTQNYESLGGYEVEERFTRICTGLKLNETFLESQFKGLSGGERTLAGLAKVLLQEPDILLLDEPTNHLDLSMLRWLEEYLSEYKGTVLIVSHDRYFLNRTVNKVIELSDGECKMYTGNYDSYVDTKKKEQEGQLHAYEEQQKQLKAMEHAMKEMRKWATQADNEAMFKRAENMRKRIERVEKIEKPKIENSGIDIAFDDKERSGKDVVRVREVSKAYDKHILFSHADMEVFYQEHVAIIGKNGCGKTTLIRMLLGEIQPDDGEVTLGHSIQLGYLPQHIIFEDEEKTILETFKEDLMVTEGQARELLARKKFYGDSVFSKVKGLSGGEKMRLKLAILMQQKINFLILDEPTNHLDIDSREKLEEALLSFKGSILFVSHDRYFIDRVATKIIEIDQCRMKTYQGNFEYYQNEKEKENIKANQSEFQQSSQQVNKQSSKQGNQQNKQDGSKNHLKKTNPYRLRKAEDRIQELDEQLRMVETSIEKNKDDYQELVKLMEEKSMIELEQEKWMEIWIELTNG